MATLDKTRADAKVMKKGIKTITGKFEDAKKNTTDLLEKLTAKATTLEKLKAKVGLSKSLDAYLQLNEFDVEEEEEDELLKEGWLICFLRNTAIYLSHVRIIVHVTIFHLFNFSS